MVGTSQVLSENNIEFFFFSDSSLELFLLIHNLDSQMLRGDKSQQIIGQLSSLRNIYLIASIDHLNAPLSKLNVTVFFLRFQPYKIFLML